MLLSKTVRIFRKLLKIVIELGQGALYILQCPLDLLDGNLQKTNHWFLFNRPFFYFLIKNDFVTYRRFFYAIEDALLTTILDEIFQTNTRFLCLFLFSHVWRSHEPHFVPIVFQFSLSSFFYPIPLLNASVHYKHKT
jgi:hypothetical protein